MSKPEEFEALAKTKVVYSSLPEEVIKLAKQLDDTKWKVISDNPIIISCGDFTLTLNYKDSFHRTAGECLFPYLQDKTNLVEYLLAVQPSNIIPQK